MVNESLVMVVHLNVILTINDSDIRQEHKYIIQKRHVHLYSTYTHKDVEIKGVILLNVEMEQRCMRE